MKQYSTLKAAGCCFLFSPIIFLYMKPFQMRSTFSSYDFACYFALSNDIVVSFTAETVLYMESVPYYFHVFSYIYIILIDLHRLLDLTFVYFGFILKTS